MSVRPLVRNGASGLSAASGSANIVSTPNTARTQAQPVFLREELPIPDYFASFPLSVDDDSVVPQVSVGDHIDHVIEMLSNEEADAGEVVYRTQNAAQSTWTEYADLGHADSAPIEDSIRSTAAGLSQAQQRLEAVHRQFDETVRQNSELQQRLFALMEHHASLRRDADPGQYRDHHGLRQTMPHYAPAINYTVTNHNSNNEQSNANPVSAEGDDSYRVEGCGRYTAYVHVLRPRPVDSDVTSFVAANAAALRGERAAGRADHATQTVSFSNGLAHGTETIDTLLCNVREALQHMQDELAAERQESARMREQSRRQRSAIDDLIQRLCTCECQRCHVETSTPPWRKR